MNQKAHRTGFYEKYPAVTWDLAEERWLSVAGRAEVLLAAHCNSCDSTSLHDYMVRATPERRHVAEFIAECQHWYECAGEPSMKFTWYSLNPFGPHG